MLLQKTEKARIDLRPGVRTLGLRERGVLLMAGSGHIAMLLPPETSTTPQPAHA
ncbi:MAG: hypothetical protein H7346_26050 [Burkholderiaceae bacterium]|nr:hypothetical protein [Burkholderiaceae bacterium]